MKTRYIIKLEGGLGNQLFQYAHAVALQKKYGGKLIIDKHAFTRRQIRSCAIENYCLCNNVSFSMSLLEKLVSYYYITFCRLLYKYRKVRSSADYHRYVKRGLYFQYQTRGFDSLVKPCQSINYVAGNWISPLFFSAAELEVKQSLVYNDNLSTKSQQYLEEISSSESVCVHIRLGDYLDPKWKDKLFVCTPVYYKEAINIVKSKVKNPKFFVFSNRHKDFEMIQRDYALGDVVYVDIGNSDVEDMELMRNCKHFIMSNSTYSWWSQFLSNNPNKVVVAPSRFNNYPDWDMTDIYQKNWNLVEV